MTNPNLALLEEAAGKLEPLLEEIAFVGGCVTGLLVNDPGAAAVRETYDVDIVAEIALYADYSVFAEQLRRLRFEEDRSEGAPICRWRYGPMVLDAMPTDATVLGFTNRWYGDALRTADRVKLSSGLTIRAITAPYFLGSKMEAFHGRGAGDYQSSHDLEDFVAVVDGRSGLLDEVRGAPLELRESLSVGMRKLLTQQRFLDALPGYLLPDAANQARLGLLRKRLEGLAEMG